MMMPSLTSSSSSSSSSSSAAMRVEKATSEFLIGPDWTMNIDICDAINNNHWLAKDIIKALKKRLQHKNPKVQLLALTLLETMVKNCGDLVHSQIAERNILQEMIKIVKKKTDMHVRDKILILLDSWQEAFGGPGGRYPQYYWTYEELRRSGLNFPQRSSNSAPIFTPPATHPSLSHTQAGYGMPSNSSTRLDEVMAAEIANLSLASISSMQNVLDLLADMLQAINPSDREAVKDEVIVDLVEQCRANQKKLMQMLTTTTSEELLAKGLELNDSLQIVLAKRDAIASGSPLPITATSVGTQLMRANEPTEVVKNGGALAAKPSAPVGWKQGKDKEEEEDDDFAQLARRHSKIRSGASGSVSEGTDDGDTTVNTSNSSCTSASLPPVMGNELALPDPPVSVKTTKEQDIIELLSLTLSTTNNFPHTQTHEASVQYMNLPSASPTTQGYSTSYSYPGNNAQALSNSYVVPWAQPQPQPQTMAQPQYLPHQPQPQYPGNLSDTQTLPQSQPQLQIQMQPQTMAQPQYLPQSRLPNQAQPQYPSNSSGTQFLPPSKSQPQPQNQLHHHSHPQPQYPQYSSGYPPPPWAVTPGYLHNSNSVSPTPYTFSTQQASTSRPLQNVRPTAGGGQKPFVPSYRLFEDLNVLGNTDARYKTSSTSPSLSGVNNPSMVGGRK